jgi:hypothetical protein
MNETLKIPDTAQLKGFTEFLISEKAQMNFARLTGDYQSLHVNKHFGRTSRYKDIIVYGLLAVAHISAVKELYIDSLKPCIKYINLKYINPLFLNSKSKLTINKASFDEENNIVKLNFDIRCSNMPAPVTMGIIHLLYLPLEKRIQIDKPQKPASAIMSPLKEEGKSINEFFKGESYCYSFKPTLHSAVYLYDILSESSLTTLPDFESWLNSFDIPGLIAGIMFSPYSGMCIPGKYGASLEQKTEFNKCINRDNEYMLEGTLTYLSASAKIVQSTMNICNLDNSKEICAHGKMTGIVYEKH